MVTLIFKLVVHDLLLLGRFSMDKAELKLNIRVIQR